MSGLILLFVLTLWVVLVLRMTRWLTSGMNVGMRKKRIQFGLLLMLLIAPVADEIWGAIIFNSACERLPLVRFYGPAPIGTGPFFDENGNRKWSTDREFWVIQTEQKGWAAVIKTIYSESIIHSFPFKIKLTRVTEVSVQKISILEFEMLNSRGGWIRRMLDGFGGYQCSSSGRAPNEQSWIKF